MSRRWFLPLMALVVVVALGVWFWAAEPEHFSERLHAQICKGRPIVRLSNATDFDWDEVVILTPYASETDADRALGFPWASFFLHRDALESEGQDVLIFLKSGRIVRTVDHSRMDGDFPDTLQGARLTQERAVFAVHRKNGDCRWAILALTQPR